ncbi:hypothetical protein QE152_g30057 [Popillia japonica]|uniref:Uncharacterized protein n=1 Tax=Popillia japonica TaxID=7064 RepID=A0AAW1JFN3_POPJA
MCVAGCEKTQAESEGDIGEPTLPPIGSDGDDLWSFHYKLVRDEVSASNSNFDRDSKLKHYLNQPVISITEDPIQFWNKNRDIHPVLSKLSQ